MYDRKTIFSFAGFGAAFAAASSALAHPGHEAAHDGAAAGAAHPFSALDHFLLIVAGAYFLTALRGRPALQALTAALIAAAALLHNSAYAIDAGPGFAAGLIAGTLAAAIIGAGLFAFVKAASAAAPERQAAAIYSVGGLLAAGALGAIFV